MVQIPRLQRLETGPAQPRTDRVKIQAPSGAQDILQRTQSLVSLGSEVIKTSEAIDRKEEAERKAELAAVKSVEDRKIKSINQTLEISKKKWNLEKMQSYKSKTGDPTDIYATYNKESQEHNDSILEQYKDASERVKNAIRESLINTSGTEELAMMRQRGAQQETYEHGLSEATIRLKRNGLASLAGGVQADSPGSYFHLDKGLHELKTEIVERAVSKGAGEILPDDAKTFSHQYKDADGKMIKVKVNDSVKLRIATEAGEGVSSAIRAMIVSGRTKEASQAFDRYEKMMDPKTAQMIKNKFKESQVEDNSFNHVGRIEALPEDDRAAAIEKIKDPEEKSKTQGILGANANRRKAARQKKNDRHLERLSNHVQEVMNSDSPYHGMADLESTQWYKDSWDFLDNKSRKAVEESIEAPKRSSDNAKSKVVDLFTGEGNIDLQKMSFNDFNKNYLVGLSKKDKDKYTLKFEKMKDPSQASNNASLNNASKRLRDKMIATGLLKLKTSGTLPGKDRTKLAVTKEELSDLLGDNPSQVTDIEARIDKLVAEKIQAKARDESGGFINTISFGLFGTEKIPEPVKKIKVSERTISPLEGLDVTERIALKKAYARETGITNQIRSSDPKFLDYVEGARK